MAATHLAGERQKKPGKRTTEARGVSREVVRSRYFYGMLLEPLDLDVDQAFHLGGRRRHNAGLHGFGTVCGLKVRDTECPWQIVLEPGVAVDCLGREIRVDCEVELDVEKVAKHAFRRGVAEEREQVGARTPATQLPDPDDHRCWKDVDLWVVLCFAEREERPVHSIGGPETCCESGCQSSRVRHGFRVYVTDEEPKRPASILDAIDCGRRGLRERVCEYLLEECRACEPDPCGRDDHHCLTLAKLDVRPDGEVLRPDNCSWRQLLLPVTWISELLFELAEEGK